MIVWWSSSPVLELLSVVVPCRSARKGLTTLGERDAATKAKREPASGTRSPSLAGGTARSEALLPRLSPAFYERQSGRDGSRRANVGPQDIPHTSVCFSVCTALLKLSWFRDWPFNPSEAPVSASPFVTGQPEKGESLARAPRVRSKLSSTSSRVGRRSRPLAMRSHLEHRRRQAEYLYMPLCTFSGGRPLVQEPGRTSLKEQT